MKLITEQIDAIEILTEEKGGKKHLYIEGTFLQGNIKNRNGRMYPMETLAREVDKYSNTYIKSGRAMGELGHPDGPIVNLDRVSHLITSLVQEGSNFKGKAKILETPMGQIAKSLLSEGVRLGVSSRGVGSLKLNREGVNVVADDFMLATAADIVADPSAPEAFVNGIMEGKEWVLTNSALKESDLRKVERDLDNASSKQELAERQITAFETFLKGL